MGDIVDALSKLVFAFYITGVLCCLDLQRRGQSLWIGSGLWISVLAPLLDNHPVFDDSVSAVLSDTLPYSCCPFLTPSFASHVVDLSSMLA